MAHSHRWSNGSASCRLEWRPSRLLQAGLLVLGTLAAFCVVASEMPRIAAWPLALMAALYGLLLARREARRPMLAFWFPGDGRPATVAGQRVEHVQVTWRGPLAFVRWRAGAGRWQRHAWWPDTLPPRARRELRLATGQPAAVRHRAGMAP